VSRGAQRCQLVVCSAYPKCYRVKPSAFPAIDQSQPSLTRDLHRTAQESSWIHDPPHISIPLHIPISNPVIRKPLPTRSRSRNRLAVELRKRQPKKKPGIMPTITEDCIDGFQQYYSRPPERPKKKSLKQMVYDSEDNSYFGRSMDSWGELEIFHCGLRKPQVLAPVASSRVDSLDKSLTLIKRISFVVALALTADADYRGCGWVEWMDVSICRPPAAFATFQFVSMSVFIARPMTGILASLAPRRDQICVPVPMPGPLVPQYRSIMPLCNQAAVNPPAFSRTTADFGRRSK